MVSDVLWILLLFKSCFVQALTLAPMLQESKNACGRLVNSMCRPGMGGHVSRISGDIIGGC